MSQPNHVFRILPPPLFRCIIQSAACQATIMTPRVSWVVIVATLLENRVDQLLIDRLPCRRICHGPRTCCYDSTIGGLLSIAFQTLCSSSNGRLLGPREDTLWPTRSIAVLPRKPIRVLIDLLEKLCNGCYCRVSLGPFCLAPRALPDSLGDLRKHTVWLLSHVFPCFTQRPGPRLFPRAQPGVRSVQPEILQTFLGRHA